MKLLWITDYPIFPVHGGSSRVVYMQSKLLAQRGHQCYVLSRDASSEEDRDELLEGVNVTHFGIKVKENRAGFLRSIAESTSAFYQLLKKEKKFDVILYNRPLTTIGIKRSHLAGDIPQIYCFHAPYAEEYVLQHLDGQFRNWFFLRSLNTMEWKAMKDSDLILFYSHFMENKALQAHPKLFEYPRLVIPLGVDTSRFPCKCKKNVKAVRQKLGLDPNRPIAFTVRRLVPRMGLRHLIDAWVLVQKEIPDAQLLIGGEGVIATELQTRIIESNLQDSVKLVGYIPEEKLPDYYKAADVFIMPSLLLEGFGLVILEALACGVPVLGTHVGGIPEILGPMNANLLFKSRHRRDMADRIIQYFKNEEWHIYTPESCRQFVESHYSWQKHVNALELILSKYSDSGSRAA